MTLPSPYFQDDAVTIYHGDCRELLPLMPKVDLVLTDPPYFLPMQSYVGTREAGYAKRMLGDISILQTYFSGLVEELPLTAAGSVYLFCDAKSYPLFWRAMFPHFKHVRTLVWDKVVSYNGYTWRHQHELIAWGEGDEAKRVATGDGDVLKHRGVLQKDRSHPAEKPVDLLQSLIAKHDDAHTILDPFMGSGTTLRAAKDLGRRAIGIEIEERYCEIAAKRMAQGVLL